MTNKCPHCSTILQQLGRNEDRGEQKLWVGENLYRCQECKEGRNRFTILGGLLMSAGAEGWLSMTAPSEVVHAS